MLERCLESAKEIADEIIIADTGSADKTKEIAARYTGKVYDFEWCDDFSAARNFAFSKATKKYILWLDADDVLLNEDAEAFKLLKKTLDTSVDVVFMKYVLSRDALGKPVFSFYRERLIKRCPHAKWVEPVHEVIVPFGKTLYSDVQVSHMKEKERTKSGRNRKIIEKYLKNGNTLSPRLFFYYARELRDEGQSAKAAKAYERFINEGRGWKEDLICACTDVSALFKALNNPKKELQYLFKSFEFAPPRAAAAYSLGQYFLNAGKFENAAYWFETALSLKPPADSPAFSNAEHYTFLPSIWLAVAYDKMGDLKKAEFYNDLAGSFKPENEAYQFNKKYFDSKKAAD